MTRPDTDCWRFPLAWPPGVRGGRGLVVTAVASMLVVLVLAVIVDSGAIATYRIDARMAAWASRATQDSDLYADVLANVTAVGSAVVVAGVTGLVCLGLLVLRRWLSLGFVVLTVGVGFLLGWLMKYLVDRPRPPSEFGLAESTPSFPSGHTLGSTLLCLTLLCILLPWEPRPRWRAIVAVAVALPLVVGATRVLLAAHFVTDVLAGWAFAVGFVAMSVVVVRPWREIEALRREGGLAETHEP